ncbi:transglutaminase-like putative cysteine protease [Nocardioides zeae]|uniref:Transglutaminase-like putative cysteine protease n=1 Tax=Nocardioides zeae TaxID=1457234 RepID=A0ACC6IG79_9ACTN|nr:transglutaminaseTgpA domain-containing protein [Nocardioides zeae]MDR6176667.1 transglutaminase-like putative cysteine protease [Nocardioides zeae]MDR6209679.1 transglutaminase-like putative cysteine protease [Nocardioides zeae]
MSPGPARFVRQLLLGLLAAAATIVTLQSWRDFTVRPDDLVDPALVAAAALLATGTALRLLPLPAVVVAALQLVVAGLLVVVLVGGSFPSPGAAEETVDRIRAALEVAQVQPPPVPLDGGGIRALLVVGAVLFLWIADTVAATFRTGPALGLPLLAAFSLPVTILRTGAPWWVFAVAALLYVAVLALHEADDLGRWGRRVVARRPGGPDGAADTLPGPPVAGTAVAVTAVGLALVAPLAVPVLDLGLLDRAGLRGGAGSAVVLRDPAADLQGDLTRGDDVELLAITTDDPGAAPPSYLRIGGLNEFDVDEQQWRPGGGDERALDEARLQLPEGARNGDPRVTWNIRATDAFSSSWLPTPTNLTDIYADSGWRYRPAGDDFTRDDGRTTAGQSWETTEVLPSFTRQDLDAAGQDYPARLAPFLEAPGVDPRIAELAASIVAGATTPADQAAELQAFFRDRDEFRYDLQVSSSSDDSLTEFLFDTRAGYCQHFASAMAVMARELGIPARVAVGFLTPELIAPGRWELSAHDLHAWPELYFPGIGWVRYEPTPGQRASATPGYSAPDPSGPGATSGTDRPTPTSRPTTNAPTSGPTSAPPSSTAPADGDQGAADGRGGADGFRPAVVLSVVGATVGVLGLLVLLLAPRRIRERQRRRRRALGVEGAWDELRATLIDHRVPWPPHRSPADTARTLVEDWETERAERAEAGTPAGIDGTALAPLERLVTRLELARYAPPAAGPGADADEAWSDAQAVADARTAGRGGARRARWLPASVVVDSRERRRTGDAGLGPDGHATTAPAVDGGSDEEELARR